MIVQIVGENLNPLTLRLQEQDMRRVVNNPETEVGRLKGMRGNSRG